MIFLIKNENPLEGKKKKKVLWLTNFSHATSLRLPAYVESIKRLLQPSVLILLQPSLPSQEAKNKHFC